MLEWGLIFAGIEKVVMVALAIIGYFIRQDLRRRDEMQRELLDKVNRILVQVNETNGRVIALETWKAGHMRETDHASTEVRESIGMLWRRLNDFIDGAHRGGH